MEGNDRFRDEAATGMKSSASPTRRAGAPATRLVFALGAVLLAPIPHACGENLLDVFQIALASDPEFLIAEANHRVAQEIRGQAIDPLLPSARTFLETAWNERHTRRDYRSESLQLQVEQPIYHRGRRIALHQADSRIAMANSLYAAAHQDLMVRVAERYFGVLVAQDELSFARATLGASKQQLAEARKRFEIGLIASTDVAEAQAGYDLSIALLIAGENALDTAREVLRETTGEDGLTPVALGYGRPVIPDPPDIGRWTEIALERNLRLLAARRDTETASLEIERIRASSYPTLDAFASLGLYDRESRIGDSWQGTVGLRLNMTLFSPGSGSWQSRESRLRYQRALHALERERRRAQRETREAYLGVSSGISRVRALGQAVRSSETAADAIETGYRVGIRTSVDVLDAQRNLFRARRDLSAARYRYLLDVLRLKRASGVLSEGDLLFDF